MKPLILFSHGKKGVPNGRKIQRLTTVAKEKGFETLAIDYTHTINPDERVKILQQVVQKHEKKDIILVGSSMGGYVSCVVANETKCLGLFLMCPALFMPMPYYTVRSFSPLTSHIEIIHGWKDKVVPFQNSVQFGKQTTATLHLVNDGHRLAESDDMLVERFIAFLDKC